jgi:hypothetical protein
MGYGEYSHAAHVAITAARLDAAPVFRADRSHPLMRPYGVTRECRDSEDHPESLAIVFALDVTGSMGDIPRQLATATLPEFMAVLHDVGVQHGQVCFLAVGHAGQDAAPLQVGQFESTATLIDQWLTHLWLEGGGAGQHEAYELAMYFAARRMRLDCVEKRGRRGYLFLTGDVAPNPAVSRAEVARIVGDALPDDIPIRDLIEAVQQQFEPFFFLAPTTALSVERAWRDLLGDRVVRMGDPEDAAHLAAAVIVLLEGAGATLTGTIDRLLAQAMPRRRAARIATALTTFAAGLGLDGAPRPWSRHADLPVGRPPSGMIRSG